MTLRKINIDISVRYVPKSGQSKESDVNTRTIKLVLFLGKIVQGIIKNFLQT